MSDSKVAAHVFVSGRVQGVWFRASTQDKAKELGVTGWVRNASDGRVEVVFEGDKKAVEEAVGWCHRGPPPANVEGVDVSWEDATGEFSKFSVRY